MTTTYTLNGWISRIEADMHDTSTWSTASMVPGPTYIFVTTPGRNDIRLRWDTGTLPKVGDPVKVTVEVGA